MAQNKSDGVLNGMDKEDIEIAADWHGDPGEFVTVLSDDGIRFLDNVDGIYHVHDWEKHNLYASKAGERSEIASNAAQARWKKKGRGAAKPSGDNDRDPLPPKGPMQNDADSNAPSMKEHCKGDEDSNAPSPSPSPKTMLSKESPPTNVGKIKRLPPRKQRRASTSKHYSCNVGDCVDSIRCKIGTIKELSLRHGWRFNVHSWIQQKTGIRGHPNAIDDSLGFLINNTWDENTDPWAVVESSFQTLNPKYNEADHIADAEKFKTLWCEELAPLVEVVGLG